MYTLITNQGRINFKENEIGEGRIKTRIARQKLHAVRDIFVTSEFSEIINEKKVTVSNKTKCKREGEFIIIPTKKVPQTAPATA